MSVFNLGTIDKSVEDENKQEVANNKNQETVVTNVDDSKSEESVEKKTIVLDGPLSHIYTQALNTVYANEAVNMMTQMMMEQEESEGSQKNPYGKDLYVYCCDGDNLDGEELVNATNKLRIALDKKQYTKVLLSIECKSVTSNKLSLLTDFSKSIGVPVTYTKSSAMDSIKSTIGVV